MSIIELNPCPKCGKKPMAWCKGNRSFVQCKSCDCLVAADDTLERTAAIWNGYIVRDSQSEEIKLRNIMEQVGGDAMTPQQVKKKEWLQRYLHEMQKLEAMRECMEYTEEECSIAEQDAERTKGEIKRCIATAGEPELEAVLIRRYLDFQTWEHIAEDMHYSLRTIYRRHMEAIDKVVT